MLSENECLAVIQEVRVIMNEIPTEISDPKVIDAPQLKKGKFSHLEANDEDIGERRN